MAPVGYLETIRSDTCLYLPVALATVSITVLEDLGRSPLALMQFVNQSVTVHTLANSPCLSTKC